MSNLEQYWKKYGDLWMSILSFALVVPSGLYVMGFFSGEGPSHIKVKVIIAPILFLIFGIILLKRFFENRD
jgi:ABC-type glycerol-3-phosphate transport system permease component